jgi:hypothetical protein
MTLRQYLDRGHFRFPHAVGMFFVWLFFLATPFVLFRYGRHAQYFGVACAFTILILTLSLPRLIPCPRCRAGLGELAELHALAEGRRSTRDPAAKRSLERMGGCSACGLRLDEEIEAGSSPMRIHRSDRTP